MSTHPQNAADFIRDADTVSWHDKAVWHLRVRRDKGVHVMPEWEELREAASNIKLNTLSNLDTYLLQFEQQAIHNGIQVHWAANGEEHNQIVKRILDRNSIRSLVKSKSILTEECGLNEFLENHNIDVVDTDLGERVIQLAHEKPSHIVAPAIHKKRMEIDELFQKTMHTDPMEGDPEKLVQIARSDLRTRFLNAKAALTGVNFAVAESGAIVVCTNEGNADMGVHLAKVHIASMGMEKVIPKMKDLGVFLRVLSRSANGQAITTYSSHFLKPAREQEMHVIIVDNGRSGQLGEKDFWTSLKCIRCGACMNTCPVYRRSGGHSYESVIPGPIGSILAPAADPVKHESLPFASTLCGSCSDVCPVKIDIHGQLYKWRQVLMKQKGNGMKKMAIRTSMLVFSNPALYRFVFAMSRKIMTWLPASILYNRNNLWGRGRELPEAPSNSFRHWYKNRKK